MRVYYQRQTRVQKVQTLSQLETLEGLIWIDLQNPSAAEIADVEANFEFKFQSRQQQLEIESSSRYFETDDEIIANSNFLHFDQQSGLFHSNAVSFILQDDILFTYRDADLSAFSDCVKKIKATGRLFHTGKQILPTLLEMGVDNDAFKRAIAAVGNYGEIFSRNIGEGTAINLARGLNALWTQGGLQYAPPFR